MAAKHFVVSDNVAGDSGLSGREMHALTRDLSSPTVRVARIVRRGRYVWWVRYPDLPDIAPASAPETTSAERTHSASRLSTSSRCERSSASARRRPCGKPSRSAIACRSGSRGSGGTWCAPACASRSSGGRGRSKGTP